MSIFSSSRRTNRSAEADFEWCRFICASLSIVCLRRKIVSPCRRRFSYSPRICRLGLGRCPVSRSGKFLLVRFWLRITLCSPPVPAPSVTCHFFGVEKVDSCLISRPYGSHGVLKMQGLGELILTATHAPTILATHDKLPVELVFGCQHFLGKYERNSYRNYLLVTWMSLQEMLNTNLLTDIHI